MEANNSNRQADTFWEFLAYLKKYVEMSKSLLQSSADDAGRTRLLSALAEYMCPVLHADMSFVGYRDTKKEHLVWLSVDKNSIRPRVKSSEPPLLIDSLEQMGWCFPYKELQEMLNGTSIVFFDKQLEKLPTIFYGAVNALAISKVILQEREYFLFFCDFNAYTGIGSRYEEFDKVMLDVATGLLEAGFESGVRGGRRVEHNEFLSGLIHDLGDSMGPLLASLKEILQIMPDQWVNYRKMVSQSARSARHLDLIINTIQLSLSESELLEEELVIADIEKLLMDAVDTFTLEAQTREIVIDALRAFDAQPFPHIPVYPKQLSIAFQHLLHNAIVYSHTQKGSTTTVEIIGAYLGQERYSVDFVNYGSEIVEKKIDEKQILPKSQSRISGLGLKTVRRIVAAHNGSLEITSVPIPYGLHKNQVRIILPLKGPRSNAQDVFLSYNQADIDTVESLAYRLQKASINPWFAKWHLIPGKPIQETIEEAINSCKSVAVCIGSDGLTKWENEEMRIALDKCINEGEGRVIPVLLPDVTAPDTASLPAFLRRREWVVFQENLDDTKAFRRLISGIRGESPGPDDTDLL